MTVFQEIEEILPNLQHGMPLTAALTIILEELKRLKEIEAMYQGLCK